MAVTVKITVISNRTPYISCDRYLPAFLRNLLVYHFQGRRQTLWEDVVQPICHLSLLQSFSSLPDITDLFSYMAYSSTLKMEAVSAFAVSVNSSRGVYVCVLQSSDIDESCSTC
jgi:hypothetical protein